MPVLKANIQNALRVAGLTKETRSTLDEQLDDSGLSLTETLAQVEIVLKSGSSDAVRLRAAETLFKIRGMMKEASAPPPAITIVIQGNNVTPETNPILLPREISVPPLVSEQASEQVQ